MPTLVKTVWNLMSELRNFTFYFHFSLTSAGKVASSGPQTEHKLRCPRVSLCVTLVQTKYRELFRCKFPFHKIKRCTVNQQSHRESPIPYMYAGDRSHVPGV